MEIEPNIPKEEEVKDVQLIKEESKMEVDEETREKVYTLQEVLEDIDDVGEVYHNMSE